MEFRGRGSQASNTPAASQPTQSQQLAGSAQPAATRSPLAAPPRASSSKPPARNLFKLGSIILLFSLTALVVALTFLLCFSGNAQQRAVQKDHYQAVFLNNGQVYFGNIRAVGNQTLDLRNIYYLQTNGSGSTVSTETTTNNNVSLVKLGCELHAPYDRMLINNDQVIFWENIQDSSQVVKAIKQYIQQNNGKLNCTSQSQNSTQQAPTSGTSGTTSGSTGTTSTGTTTKTP